MQLSHYLKDFFSLFYPELCAACSSALLSGEKIICTYCRFNLPYTQYHLDLDNPVAKHFWGRVQIERASSCFHFRKGTRVQSLLHGLKYQGRKDVGVFIGRMYGGILAQSEQFKDVNIIVPVPLHKSKLLKRGYNQSAAFADGLSEGMGIQVDVDVLIRSTQTETQTRKSRYTRYENMKDVFFCKKKSLIEGKHILLVDDVVTTGATLEACASVLLKVAGTKVSVITIASTD